MTSTKPKRMTPKQRQIFISRWAAGYQDEIKDQGFYVIKDKNGKDNLRRKRDPPVKSEPKVEVVPNPPKEDTFEPIIAHDPSAETAMKIKDRAEKPKDNIL
jgi:hypothetical protein